MKNDFIVLSMRPHLKDLNRFGRTIFIIRCYFLENAGLIFIEFVHNPGNPCKNLEQDIDDSSEIR